MSAAGYHKRGRWQAAYRTWQCGVCSACIMQRRGQSQSAWHRRVRAHQVLKHGAAGAGQTRVLRTVEAE